MQRWRTKAMDFFSLFTACVHFPLLAISLMKADIPWGAKVMVTSAWLLIGAVATLRRAPANLRVILLAVSIWLWALAMLSRGGGFLGFRVTVVTTPFTIMLLGGVRFGVFFGAVNLVGAVLASWATAQGWLLAELPRVYASDWLFHSLPLIGAMVPQLALLAWFTHVMWTSVQRESRMTHQLRDEAEERQRLEGEVQNAAEREKQRIGSELHDGVCQDLTGLLLLAKRVQKSQPAPDSPLSELMSALVSGLGRTIGEVQGLSRHLSPGCLTSDELPGALGDLVRRTSEATETSIVFRHRHEADSSCTQDALNVFRLVQEALSNALRHSGADVIEVSLQQDHSGLTVAVDDNGSGLPDEAGQGGEQG